MKCAQCLKVLKLQALNGCTYSLSYVPIYVTADQHKKNRSVKITLEYNKAVLLEEIFKNHLLQLPDNLRTKQKLRAHNSSTIQLPSES